MAESDRDILIELRTKVTDIHREMTDPSGKVPKLEVKVENHAKQISSFSGGLRVTVWILGGLGLLFVGLSGVVLAHILGGK
jgi:hypothetical protein